MFSVIQFSVAQMLQFLQSNTDILFQAGQTSNYWIDGSPYTFQMWKQSADSNLNLVTYISIYGSSGAYHDNKIERQKTCVWCIDNIEPLIDITVNCTAAVITAEGTIKWSKVPCAKEHDASSYICEIQKTDYQPATTQSIKSHVRSYMECPPRAIQITDRCIRVYTSVLRNHYDMTNICLVQNATLYHVPRSIALNDPLSHGQRDNFLIGFLQAMNHRWPGLADYGSTLTDELLMANVNSTEPVVFRFSLTTISHVELDAEQSKKEGTGSVHAVCEFPLLPVSSECLAGHFSCDDGTCILEHYFCDGIKDCLDRTDEVDCDHVCTFSGANNAGRKDCFSACVSPDCTCSALYFQCSLGGCIPWSRVCDGVNDCPNNEDEQVCEFYYLGSVRNVTENSDTLHFADDPGPLVNEFQCKVGIGSIPLKLKNDLVPDCLDQSDENEYQDFLSEGSKTTYSTNVSLCHGSEETTCVPNFPGVCYPRHLYCTYELHQLGTVGCRNGGHLSNCQYHTCPSQFKCPDAYCIPVHTVCDGKQDCPGGEDERNCQSISCPGFLLCRHDNTCVHPYDVWSVHVKCPMSMDDKALTNVPRCPMLCLCLGYAISCKSPKVIDLPHLRAALRVLLLDKVRIGINNINFREGITFLLDLQVTNANLEQLHPEHLSSFLFLKNLNMSFNNLTRLGPQTFSALHNLEKMDLSHNLLGVLHPDIFTGLHILRQLNLNHNSIQQVSHCSFQNLRQLEILKLSHNKLTRLGKNILCRLRLKELDISYNSISMIEENVLIYKFQHLKTINTIPKRICCICCNVHKESNCYPKVKLTKFSSCSGYRLVSSSALRGILWFVGSILSLLISGAVAWFTYKISVGTYNKILYNVLFLLLFVSNVYVSIYFLTILTIDQLSAGYYSFFDETWRHHSVASLLHTLSYAFFQTTPFVCFLISSVRTISIINPFKVQGISIRVLLTFILIWFVVFMCLGYSSITWIVPEYKDSPESALGLGLLLPGLGREEGYVQLYMLLFIFPNATVLLFFCLSQAMLIQRLNKTPIISDVSRIWRMKTIRASVNALLLVILQYCPFLVVHILAMVPVAIKANVEVVTIWTLVFIPTGNVLLYVLYSNDFQCLFSKICSHCFKGPPPVARDYASGAGGWGSILDHITPKT